MLSKWVFSPALSVILARPPSHGLFILLIQLLFLAPLSLPTSSTTYAQAVIPPPLFSAPHGFYNAPLQLTLSTPTANAIIRYTLDFSTPTPTNGIVYTVPIPIDKTSIVRAIAYTSSANKSATVTQSYIFLNSVKTQPTNPGSGWPTVFAKPDASGPYPADYEVDPEVVNHPNNGNGVFENALRAIPSVSIVTDQANLWNSTSGIYYNQQLSGSAWERAASIEWLDPNGGPGFTENSAVRIHGQASRRPFRTPKKSFRFYFKLPFGKTKLDFKLFADNDATSKFDRIVLRGGHNYSWGNWDSSQRRQANYFADQFSRDVYRQMGHLSPHGDYVHVYLNGLYWGLYNIAEHINEKYLSDYTGVPEFTSSGASSFDLIEVAADTNYAPQPEVGDLVKWNELQAKINVSTVSNTVYQDVQQRIDVVNLADYMIVQHYLGNTDWPDNNWSAWRVRSGADTRFRIFVWDTETGFNNINNDVSLRDAPDTPAHIFLKLMTNAEFKQLVNDRFWWHLVKANGLLTPAGCQARVTQLAGIIDQAIIGESARWGDYSREVYRWPNPPSGSTLPAYLYSRDLPDAYADPSNQTDDALQTTWLDIRDSKLTRYCPDRPGILTTQYTSNTWLFNAPLPPAFSQDGGEIPVGFSLAIANTPNAGLGDIYYTTDGSDPRAFGGAVASGAVNGADAVTVAINQVTTVKARVLNGAQWSPLMEATFYPPQSFTDLVINEIHYHPTATLPANPDDFEFIELFNKGGTPLRLDNVKFTRGFTFKFPLNTVINPGAYLVLASNSDSFQSRYKFAAYGQMRGNLSNGGEAIELTDAVGKVIDVVNYLDLAPWPTTPDNGGPSLSLIDPALDNAQPTSWAASIVNNGTPGQPNGLVVPNQPPGAAITQPASNAIITVGLSTMISATASDSDGAVAQVQFFANSAPLDGCIATTAPYTCSWTPTAAGAVLLSAVATDNLGAVGTSAAITVSVNPVPNQLPTVTLTQPTNGANLVTGTSVTLTARATDNDGSIKQVEFWVDNAAICLDDQAPFICPWTAVVGEHTLTAMATDNLSATVSTTISVTVTTIVNQPPSASINSPLEGTEHNSGVPLTIVATATDADGSVQEVVFLANNNVICTDTSAPYECAYTPVAAGEHQLQVRVVDEQGLANLSSVVKILVTPRSNPDAKSELFLPLIRN